MNDIENKGKYLVVQANKLVEASYKLKIGQQKFLRLMASMIKKDDEDFKIYEFKIAEVMELFDIKGHSSYTEIPKQTRELMGNVLIFKTSKKIIQVPFLNYCEYEIGTGILRVQFHPFLRPMYLSLNSENPFTKYQLQNILPLKSVYSIRFYEFLKQYEKIGHRAMNVEEIRELFKIKPDEYTRYNDFKRKVIIQAQKELPLKTDISFEFEEIKTGRKVTNIKFYIKQNNAKKAIDEIAIASKEIETDPRQDLKLIKQVQVILKEYITDLQAKELLDTAKGDINIIKEKYKISKITSDIKNIMGWMLDAIKKDYQAPEGNGKVDSFNDYPQRNYDFVDLEKKLSGWHNKTDEITEEDFKQLSMDDER